MSEEKIGFLRQVWGCVASPRKAFESIQGEDLWRGMLLIIIMTLVSAWAGFMYTSKLPFNLPEESEWPGGHSPYIDTEAFRRNIMTFSALNSGLRVVAGWLISSVLLHLFASLLVGKGSLKRMLALTGFASIPLIIQQLLRLIDAYTISREEITGLIAARFLGRTFVFQFMSNVLGVFTVFGIWSFALTVVAVSVKYKSSVKRSSASAVVAYLVFILLRIFLPI